MTGTITIRLRDDERQALDELAARTNLRRSDLLRLGLAAVVIDVGQVVSFVQAGQRAGDEAASPASPPQAAAARRRRRRGKR